MNPGMMPHVFFESLLQSRLVVFTACVNYSPLDGIAVTKVTLFNPICPLVDFTE